MLPCPTRKPPPAAVPFRLRPMARHGARALFAGILAAASLACPPEEPADNPCAPRRFGDLVVSELMIDPDGPDTGGEWIELFNSGTAPIELKGLQVYTAKPDRSGLKVHTLLAGTVEGRGYFTLGDVREGPNPPWVGYAYGDDLGSLPQSGALIGVRCGTTVLDELVYAGGDAARSRMLGGASDPDATANDDASAWCDTPEAEIYSTPNAGTPGRANGLCAPTSAKGRCVSLGFERDVVAPAPGDLVITEIMANPAGVPDSTGEWLEVLALRDVDLNDVVLTVGDSRSVLRDAGCLRLGAMQLAVLARSLDAGANGGLPPPLATFGVSLPNGEPLALGLRTGDAGIDEALVPMANSGFAWQLVPSAFASLATLPAANDTPEGFCLASTPSGVSVDFGTPGFWNAPCRVPPDGGEVDAGADGGVDGGSGASDAGLCFDAPAGAWRAPVEPRVGDLTLTEVMANPQAVDDPRGEWFELFAARAVDLVGLALGSEGATRTVLQGADCRSVDAGSSVLFARSADPAQNGGLPPVFATFGSSLGNEALADGGARAVVVELDGGLLDRFEYATPAAPGRSWQLSADLLAPGDNDVPANLCAGPADLSYGTGRVLDGGAVEYDRGSPGAPNASCPQ